MSQQLTFDLATEPALSLGDFFIAPSNAAAVDAVQNWHDWPMGKLILAGPHGSGKSHLAHVWAAMVDAKTVAAVTLETADIDQLAMQSVAVEDVDQIAGNNVAEEAMFHLHNFVLERGHSMLITSLNPPARWGLNLPDLKSRMQGSALVSVDTPDDTLLSAVMVKLFKDRQIVIEPDLVGYLVLRMERSFAGVGRLVDALDREALRQKKKITKPMAAQVLDKLAENEA